MTSSDLLQRVPELAAVADDPSVARALASGDPFRVYRALWWGNLRGRFGAHADVVRGLLARRTLFVKPLGRAPSMYTMNGVGTAVYGAAEPDRESGVGIGTHWFVVVFVPLIPLGAYLCRPIGDGKQFFGRVPLGMGQWLWSRALVGATGASVVSAAGFAVYASLHATVHVANPFTAPLDVRIGDAQLTVPAGEVGSVSVSTGATHMVAELGGRVVAEHDATLEAGNDVNLWNVLGATPVVRVPIVYEESPGASGLEPETTPLCGTSWWVSDDVDYVLTEPPQSVELPSGSRSVTRQALLLAPGGWTGCVNALGEDDPATALTLVDAVLPTLDETGLRYAVGVRRALSDDVAAWAEQALGARTDVGAIRVLQEAVYAARGAAAALDWSVARFGEDPADADAAYLRWRFADDADWEALGAKFPEHAWITRSRGLERLEHARWADGDQLLVAASHADPMVGRACVSAHMEALVAQARASEALVAGTAAVEDLDVWGILVLARAEQLTETPHTASSAAAEAYGGPHLRALVEVLVQRQFREDLVVGDVQARASLHAIHAVLTNAPEALDELRATAEAPTWDLVRPLLVAHALRAGDDALARKLAGDADPLAAWVIDGGDSTLLDQQFGAVRASYEVARASVPNVTAEERARLLADARLHDVLGLWLDRVPNPG